MFKYNLRLIFRNFKRNKSSFFINLIGLAAGFACAILIFMWVMDEESVDKFHKLDKQLYQVMENNQMQQGILTQAWTPDMLGRTFASELPEVEMQTSVMPAFLLGNFAISSGTQKLKAAGQFADADFFRIFSFRLLQGDPSQVLKAKNSIVISENWHFRCSEQLKMSLGKPSIGKF